MKQSTIKLLTNLINNRIVYDKTDNPNYQEILEKEFDDICRQLLGVEKNESCQQEKLKIKDFAELWLKDL